MFSPADYAFMSYALRLAEKGLYGATPNPRVGCVITYNEQIVGSGWHERAGQPHAEINALNNAGGAARGATVYVTLEPCAHYGRTPPCVNALITAGIARVIIAMKDPNPLVSGRGKALLELAGIDVQVGLLEAEASALNVGFVTRMIHKKPWVRIKTAASLDGKTALNNGVSQWITGESARQDGHRWRARSCAILTGIGTVKSDNPQLTVRHIKTHRQPKKIVVDSHLVIPLDAKLLQAGEEVCIFTANNGNPEKNEALSKMGVRVIVLSNTQGRVDLEKMITTLADFGMNEVLVEAGCRLNGALVEAGLVNEMIIFLAPHLLGDNAQGMFQLPELINLEKNKTLRIDDLRMIGQDIRIIVRLL
ncbi:MAG: bifunctional diaminohydroxyphosphoribosylaminopyrimidine deaminase/5-amino-6-(5-phosphoribosylamino)uracil reductase RibD [Nitrosomonas sp.]|uniref:bifunctional diaminohydroxyphosphoribosylaminopyrimidine deaminase/5-amino-6-(5-phosphoribosylamino)uracil reductase RibD n=1 Tax=Nitrosomonas sp. TaxID=42353 RepID=UPI002733B6E6|nr:bifunctional diaminohydroxyphosphoribosylaminopyrimidine deaminase/5-amino-6-(5-phosphoribosylamino)uracil reductase RibD [Nitrosomonas sp.]MDP3663438.1 bifunctional diaminohydroxyphosphoribosylaminopyrimidine deaminase/5-amino-6-(5-phosphoribosylamino)uracil reductase RibD [Nitrosomonas sp.]MDZ4105776.1 bifunctional diaminohydroxyphosphoribosylaminopyrimidine deaminase/5-amino-6-(5-phosphoribosylamino)uracil reductase RibD [Nitrosomonas sp.]